MTIIQWNDKLEGLLFNRMTNGNNELFLHFNFMNGAREQQTLLLF